MPRPRTTIASLLGVALLAVPALPVTVGNTAWTTSGKSIAKVKGLGKAKGEADLLLTFFTGGDVRVEDAFEHTFTGSYVVTGRKQNTAEMSLGTASTTLLENVFEQEIESAVLDKAGTVADVTVDITSVTAKAHFNAKGTKVRFKLKAKAIGFADVDPRRRRATYTVTTKGAPPIL